MTIPSRFRCRKWNWMERLGRRHFQQSSCVAMQHRFALAFGAVHLLDFLHRHPISQSIRIIRSNENMICADHAFKVLNGIDSVHQVVEVKVLQIAARRLRSGKRLSATAPTESLIKTAEMVGEKAAAVEQPQLELGKPVENSAVNHKAHR